MPGALIRPEPAWLLSNVRTHQSYIPGQRVLLPGTSPPLPWSALGGNGDTPKSASLCVVPERRANRPRGRKMQANALRILTSKNQTTSVVNHCIITQGKFRCLRKLGGPCFTCVGKNKNKKISAPRAPKSAAAERNAGPSGGGEGLQPQALRSRLLPSFLPPSRRDCPSPEQFVQSRNSIGGSS